MFSCELYEILQSIVFTEHLGMSVSESCSK